MENEISTFRLDQVLAIRATAEREIRRIDRELLERPNSPALADARRDWARVAYLAQAELEKHEAVD